MSGRASGARSVLAVVRYEQVESGRQRFDDACRRLLALYRPVLGETIRQRQRWLPAVSTGVVVVDQGPAVESSLDPMLVWGTPVDQSGLATADAVAAALRIPESGARPLLGVFVLLSADDHAVRAVTSASLVHTLKRVDGAGATAWATRGLAAHVLTDRRPELHEDAIAEHVTLDYPLRTDELLVGTRVLPDASVLDIDASGARERTYWPLAERVQPGPPTTARDLVELTTNDVRAMAQVPGVSLGLTAGRDSLLLAGCLADAGGSIPTFTLGRRGYADPQGARAVAKTLGWRHDVVPSDLHWATPWSRMAELSVWTEGMQSGTALLEPTYQWQETDVVWLGGNGAEIGRGFYWARHGDPAARLRELRTSLRDLLPASTATTTLGRLDVVLDDMTGLGRPPDSQLDLFYATGRMAKWLCRDLPTPQFRDVLPGFLSPPLVRALLDVPFDDRRSGRPFEEALAMHQPNLRQIAARAAQRKRLSSLRGPTRRQVVRRLSRMLQRLPREAVTRRVLGDAWLESILSRAPHAPWATRQAWNAVAVEAFAVAVEGMNSR